MSQSMKSRQPEPPSESRLTTAVLVSSCSAASFNQNANADRMNGQIMSQVDKDTTVRSVYLFGKKHRPDLTINEDGIAIEIKYLSGNLDGLKQAIG